MSKKNIAVIKNYFSVNIFRLIIYSTIFVFSACSEHISSSQLNTEPQEEKKENDENYNTGDGEPLFKNSKMEKYDKLGEEEISPLKYFIEYKKEDLYTIKSKIRIFIFL